MPNFINPGSYLADPSGNPGGFAIPPLGGAMGVRYGTMIWTGTVGTICQLPQGAQIVDFTTDTIESFNGGTASLRVGDTTTNNRWASTIDIGTAGFTRTGYVGSQTIAQGTLTSDTYVLATLNAPGTATQGTLGVIVYYMMR